MTENAAELVLVLIVLVGLLVLKSPNLRTAHIPHSDVRPPDLEGSLLLGLIVATMVVMPVVDVLVPWLEFADFKFFGGAAWVGLALGCVAVWLFWRAEADQLRAERLSRIIMEVGIYRHMRHPFYSAMLLWCLAQLLLLQNWLAGPAAAITFLVVYLLRVPRDEQLMLERFGHLYLDYMERTGELWPRWRVMRK